MSAPHSITHQSPASPTGTGDSSPPRPSPIDDIDRLIARVSAAARTSNSSFSTQLSMEESPDDSNSVAIEANLIELLINGNIEAVLTLESNLWKLKSTDNSSVLHIIATNSSQSTLILDILPISRDMIKWKNTKGDLAFHSAAKAGQLDSLKALTDWGRYDDPAEREIDASLLGIGNNDRDTPLHIALENNQEDVAWYLVNQYKEACCKLNLKKVCPIYLAIKAGYWDLVKRMLELIKERIMDNVDVLLQGKSIVHAAIEARNLEILTGILETHGNLIRSYDGKCRTPLSYAAFKGYLELVQYLVRKFPDSAYNCDEDENGSFPIHKAASGGHIKVIKELQSTKQLLNRKGQNILHVAAGSGKSTAVAYLLKIPELERLINLKDEDGNTPLHLATLGFHPRVVYILTRERKVKPGLTNKDGLTALDLAEINAGSNPTFEARLTWMALRYIDAPRSSQSTRKSYVQRKQEEQSQSMRLRKQTKKQNDRKELESYKDRIDTNLLVATLIATVTFAAGFTLPGGYKQDDPQIGMALLSHKWAFQVFVICDTAAMYSSILAVVTLIWAHLGDLKLVLVSLKFALPMLGFALSMMSLAFMMGLYVVLRNQLWLSYVVLGIGSVFLVVVLGLFIPLYNPSYIRNPIVRFFFSGTFLLLLLVCEKSRADYV